MKKHKAVGMLVATLVVGAFISPSNIAAQGTVAPIVIRQYVVGGSSDGKWVGSGAAARSVPAGTQFRVYTPAGLLGTARGNTPRTDAPLCEDRGIIDLTPRPQAPIFLAWGGATNPLPRQPSIIPNTSTFYRNAVATVLRANGIRNPDVRLRNVVRVDLEGDGETEVIIDAARMESNGTEMEPGNYSLIVMRKVIRGRVETIPVRAVYFPAGGPIFNRAVYTLAGIADLNADGKMEIGVYISLFESDGAFVYSVSGRRVTAVLGVYCGP